MAPSKSSQSKSRGTKKKTTKKPSAPRKQTPTRRKPAQSPEERMLELKKMLQERKQEMLARAADRSRVLEINSHGDLVDQSTDLSERELRMGLAEHDRQVLADINEALEKIEIGQYGICSSCGVEIPTERLVAIPTATLCVPCKERQENESMGAEETTDFYAQEIEE